MKLKLLILLVAIATNCLAQNNTDTAQSPETPPSPSPSAAEPVPSPVPEELEGGGQAPAGASPAPAGGAENLVIVSSLNTDAASPSPSPTTPSTPSPTPSESTPSPSPSPPSTPSVASTTTTSSTTTSTTTPQPEPVPAPPQFPDNVGNWSIYNGSSPCILLTSALQLRLKDASNPSSEISINVPNTLEHVNVSGHCGEDRQTLNLHWFEKVQGEGERETNLHLEFSRQPDDQYALTAVKVRVHDVTQEVAGQFFVTKLGNSFRCQSNQRVETEENSQMYLLTEKLQFEAFREPTPSEEDFKFSEADYCKADHHMSTSTILWIGIGIGLAIISVIALGVCLCRRCRRDGYQPLDAQT